MKKFRILSLLALGFLAGCANLDYSVWRPVAGAEIEGELILNLTPGTYQGSSDATFGPGPLTLEVTVNETNILSVEIVSHSETQGFLNNAVDGVIPAVLERNSSNVDIASGATITSNAILEAIEVAMASAGADIDVLRALGAVGELQNFAPGVIRVVSGSGFGGEMVVYTTFSDSAIEDIVVYHNETAGFGDSTLGHLISRAKATNSANIDIVGSATITSNAFINALQEAIDLSHSAAADMRIEALGTQEPTEEIEPEVVEESETQIETETETETEELLVEDESEEELVEVVTEDVAQETTGTPLAPPVTGNFTPGTHTGSAQGFLDAVNVTVTVSETGYITNITFTHSDTEMFADMAGAVIPAIIDAQSTNVAAISGATVTADAIIAAVASAVN